MTAITYVSQKEMKKRTGLSTALGYSLPEEDEILVRKGLDPELKKEVLAHEEEHIEKGEEGPFWGAVIGGAAALFGAKKSSDAQKSAAKTAAAGSERELEFNRESRDLARADQAPYVSAGHTALSALMDLTGLSAGRGGAATSRGPLGSFGPDTPLQFRGPRAAARRPNYNGRPNPRISAYAGGGHMYNVNELGPENRYTGGAITRNPNPMTIDGETGYVLPHSRAYGGFMGGAYDNSGKYPSYSPPNKRIGGATTPTTGIDTTSVDPNTGFPRENPGGVEGGYQFQTDPGYQFRVSEGLRAMDRSAAQRGGLLSGGYGRALTRYGQDYASQEYTNVYNRISNIAGLGQVSAGQSGNYALQAGRYMGNAASEGANATAYGQIGSGNAWANAGNQIAQLPWGDIFGGSSPSGGGGAADYRKYI